MLPTIHSSPLLNASASSTIATPDVAVHFDDAPPTNNGQSSFGRAVPDTGSALATANRASFGFSGQVLDAIAVPSATGMHSLSRHRRDTAVDKGVKRDCTAFQTNICASEYFDCAIHENFNDAVATCYCPSDDSIWFTVDFTGHLPPGICSQGTYYESFSRSVEKHYPWLSLTSFILILIMFIMMCVLLFRSAWVAVKTGRLGKGRGKSA